MANTEFRSADGRWRQPRTAHETRGTDGHLRSLLHQVKEQTELTLFKRNRYRPQWRVGLLQGLHSFRARQLPGRFEERDGHSRSEGHYTPVAHEPLSRNGDLPNGTVRLLNLKTWKKTSESKLVC